MMQSVEEIRQGKWARKDKMKKTPSQDYVSMVCRLYGDVYDDREEDSKINGLDWEPGLKSAHKSLGAFQKELNEVYGIHLSRTKLQKILITGGCWTTERSREVQWLYSQYTAEVKDGGLGLDGNAAIQAIAKHLKISDVSVIINLPYGKAVYDLEEKTKNAKRIERYRMKKR